VGKLAAVLSLINVPALMFIAFFAEPLLRLLYGDRYAAGAPLLPLLFANEIVFSFNTAMAAVFISMGRTSQMRKYAIIRAVVVVLLILPAFRLGGVVGAACVPLTAALIAFGYQLTSLGALTGLPAGSVLRAPVRGMLCGLPIALGWVLSRMMVSGSLGWQSFTWLGIGLAVVYGLLGMVVYKNPRLRQMFWPAAIARKEC
jgi:PST family polysaccharide transporter